jgi:hypothetical protein
MLAYALMIVDEARVFVWAWEASAVTSYHLPTYQPPHPTPLPSPQAYKRMALEHHPDKGGDKDAFIAINAAYETLSDDAKRAEYDDERAGRHPRGFHGGGVFHHGG